MIRTLTLSALLIAHPLIAQTLMTGTWQGEVTMHEEEPAVTAFRVQTLEDAEAGPGYAITMFHNERPYPFEALSFEEQDMLFTLDTGVKYRCRLAPTDTGGYQGQCQYGEDEDEARFIDVSMKPPATEAYGDAPQEESDTGSGASAAAEED